MLIPLKILIPVTVAIIILIIVLWILYSKSKKLYGKLSFDRERFSLYKKHLEVLKKLPKYSEKDFNRFNQVVRAFFKEYFDLSFSLTYLELAKYFKKEKPDYARFCKLMSDVNYKGEKTKTTEIKNLVNLFSDIIEKL